MRTYNCSPCSKCFIPFCEMEMATAVEWNSLFPRSYMQYSTELQKLMVTFNQSNEVLLYVSAMANCSLIKSHKASTLPHGEGRAWSTEYTTAVQPHWIQRRRSRGGRGGQSPLTFRGIAPPLWQLYVMR